MAPVGANHAARQQNVEASVANDETVPADPRQETTATGAGSGYAVLQTIDAYAPEQEGIFAEFQETSVPAYRDRDAYILSELWKAGLLKNEIKDALVERHYSLVLLQARCNYTAMNFVVRCYQTFPFPNSWVDFTPTLYINGEVVWAPAKRQKAHAMSLNNSTITSRTGGAVKNGDVIQYQVRISPTVDEGIPWEKTIWSNKIVAQGLED